MDRAASIWVIRAGPSAAYIDAFERDSIIAISYPEVGAVDGLDRHEIEARVVETTRHSESKAVHIAGALHRFASVLRVNDWVLVSDFGRSRLLVGRIASPYR